MNSLKWFDVLINSFVIFRSISLMYKVKADKSQNGLSDALFVLLLSTFLKSIWAVYVVVILNRTRLDVIMGHVIAQSLRVYSLEQLDKELFDG